MGSAHDITAVLLPSAQIHFYAIADSTAEAAAAVAEDWRFARVGITTIRGGMDAAIADYKDKASPEMIIIETDDISDVFIAKLADLAAVCSPGTDAVIIGPKNDVHLYRSLIEMGVRDYLVRPVGKEDMVKIIAKALVEKNGLSGSSLVTVIGSKGGVGTSSIAQIMGTLVADSFGQKTVLMDVAGTAGILGISFGLEPLTSLTEGVKLGQGGSEDDLKRVLQPAGQNLSILTWGNDPILTDSPGVDSVEALINRLMQKNPVIVMDLSGALPSVQKRMMSKSAHVIVVTTPSLTSLRNARTLLNEIKGLRGGLAQVSVVLNKKGIFGTDETSAVEIEKALGIAPSASVPQASKIFLTAELSGQPLSRAKTEPDFMKSLQQVASRALGMEKKQADAGKTEKGPLSFLKNIGKK